MHIFSTVKSRIKGWPVAAKIVFMFAILLMPMAVTSAVLKPFTARRNASRIPPGQTYQLRKGFQQSDLNDLIGQMRHDSEYQFYFRWMPQRMFQTAVSEVYHTLDMKRYQSVHKDALDTQKAKIESAAALFNNLNYPAEFFKNPDGFPDLSSALWGFFYEEFKLAVMGLAYQAIYDRQFRFNWTDGSRRAGAKLQTIISRLNGQ